jgi:uncharacterized Zn-binding protein involved in type VI secretion
MPAVARSNGADSVFSRTGIGRGCRSPVRTSTGSGSSTVFVGGVPVVKRGDMVAFHLAQGCAPDLSTLSSSSSTVFVNGQGIGRIGDEYTSDNIITSGFPTVFAR